MKKLLTELAKRRHWTLPLLAEKMETPYSTVYGYDRGDRKMPVDFVDRVSDLLGVDREEILQNYAEQATSGGVEKTQIMAGDLLELLSDELIEQIIQHLARRLPGAENGLMRNLMDALQAISDEKERRRATPAPKGSPPAKGNNPAYRPLNSVSEDEAATSVAAAERALELERKGSSPSAGAAGPSGHKHGTSQSTSPESKGRTPPPGRAPK